MAKPQRHPPWLPLLTLAGMGRPPGPVASAAAAAGGRGPKLALLAAVPDLSLLQLSSRTAKETPRASEEGEDRAARTAGLAGSGTVYARLLALMHHRAAGALLGGPSRKEGGESAFGGMLEQLGLAVVLGCACIATVAGYKAWHGKFDLYEVLLTAGVCQLVVLGATAAVYLLENLVTIPVYAVVFIFGTLGNGLLHCKELAVTRSGS